MKQNRSMSKMIFIVYSLILVWVVLFKMAFSLEDVLALQSVRSINFVPFSYGVGISRIQIREVLLNFLIFIPVGLYLKMFDFSGGKVISIGFLSSFAFELIQFVFAIGTCDITDLITNTLGTAVGAILYLILRKLCSQKEKTDRFLNLTVGIVLLLFGGCVLFLLLANR